MNKQLKQFEKDSGLEIFGLGARREIWEAAVSKYAELIVRECADVAYKYNRCDWADVSKSIKEHFGVEE